MDILDFLIEFVNSWRLPDSQELPVTKLTALPFRSILSRGFLL